MPHKVNKVLELGCGWGRATDVALDVQVGEQIDLVDLSSRMLTAARQRYDGNHQVKYIQSDMIDFLLSTDQAYDLVYSLWSFSHSVHQNLLNYGEYDGTKRVLTALNKLFRQNTRTGSHFYLVHFDVRSPEQRVIGKLRKMMTPIWDSRRQSPSKLLLDQVMIKLEETGILRFEIHRLNGQEIVYGSVAEALEIFMNFHLEAWCNTPELAGQAVDLIERKLEKLQDSDGKIRIRPGCFIYKAVRL